MPDIGVVIPAREAAETLGPVLDALERQRVDGQMHIVVVVNGSRDASTRVAAAYTEPMRAAGHYYQVASSRSGRASAIRVGERLLPMSIRVFLDSDAVVSENAMSELATTLPGTGIHFAAPRLALAR